MKYLAHISDSGESQKLYDHLRGVADRMIKFGSDFDAQKEAEQIGLAHDIGKFSDGFARRLSGGGPRVDHSTAGAIERWKRKDIFGALCVAGHHGGLPDLGAPQDNSSMTTLCGRLKRGEEGLLEDYSAYKEEICMSAVQLPDWIRTSLNGYFYTKMLFSCLVDADFLDTEAFMQGEERRQCGENSVEELWVKLQVYIEPWKSPSNELNCIRSRILGKCIEAGKAEKGLYSLTVPTGGGKTVSSLAFALQQACTRRMSRIIYVIPYTSIIDQTVDIFEKILGEGNVLAHYCDVSYDGEEETVDRKKLAAENWDFPVIVTTAVQFFESIYSNKPSKCRKIHCISDSVLVFDEYQAIPLDQMKPCTEAIYQLVRYYGCTALLCTATQPETGRFFHGMRCREIIEDTEKLYQRLGRVCYRQAGKTEPDKLAGRLMGEKQVLCIVNARKTAQELYGLLGGEGNFHLSTWMCPKDRKEVICEVRKRLSEGQICRVVSTSLIEAGIDVDFPTVYREESGLDSIVQAAGRCNREGKRPRENSIVWIFSLDRPCPVLQRVNRDSMLETLRLGYEIGLPETVTKYFRILLDNKGENALDREKIVAMCERGGENGLLPFRTIAERFRMINQDTRTVYIPCDKEGEAACRRLAQGERTRELFRKLGNYSVSLYPQYYDRLRDCGALLEFDENAVILSDLSLYRRETGIRIPENEGYAGFFI